MALTQAQYNHHVRLLVTTGAEDLLMRRLIRIAMTYTASGSDQREAALRLIQECFQTVFGVDPTSTTVLRHRFKHWIEESAPGQGIEA